MAYKLNQLRGKALFTSEYSIASEKVLKDGWKDDRIL